ncbi:MAG TPA: hypothetical protein VK421_00005, partial [Pyrinomonadaceae bacterium]|nr:hypothetical protein [Pyrinomonadaceae bacterium]
AACLLAAASLVAAQQPAQPKRPAAKETASAAADPAAANRRATAVTLLSSLADEARSFREPNLRARVQAQAADALWETEQESARALFRRAWEAAEQADQENTRRRDAERRLPPTGAGAGQRASEEMRVAGGAPRPGSLAGRLGFQQIRSEVLRLAARRDRALGEEFLAKMGEARRQEERDLSAATVAGAATDAAASAASAASTPSASGATAPPPSGRNPHEAAPDEARRLQLASQFLAEGDTERAMQFAEPALRSVNTASVEFLVNLREKNAGTADRLFLSLLGAAANDPATNANAALILSSYVLTPHMYMTIGARGPSVSMRRREITPPEGMPPAVRAAFAQFASSVLLRPLPPPDQDPNGINRVSTYFVAGRLMPFFEQTLADRGARIRALLAAISTDVPPDARAELEDDMKEGLIPSAQRDDEQLQNALDAAERATNPAERDSAYMRAALTAARTGDPRARDFAAKIEDPGLRQQVRSYVDFTAVNSAVQRRDGLEVLKLTQSGDITPSQRVWGYTEAARLLSKDDRPRALEALESAFDAAKKIDAEDPDRARSLVAVATQYAALDRNRAWEVMAEAVKAANAAPEFTGSDAGVSATVQAGNMRSMFNSPAPSFDLSGIFSQLARDDMNRAVAIAQTFTQEGPRAAATLAAVRAALEDA